MPNPQILCFEICQIEHFVEVSDLTSIPRIMQVKMLSNWVEEVQDISSFLGASFHHIFREANVMADVLAKEGVFHTSILFYV